MSKHTTGPWKAEEGTPNITRYWNGKNHVVATVSSATLAWHENSNSASDEAWDNARLIAAAPELHEALHELLLALQSAGPGTQEAYDNAIINGENLLRKLEGKPLIETKKEVSHE